MVVAQSLADAKYAYLSNLLGKTDITMADLEAEYWQRALLGTLPGGGGGGGVDLTTNQSIDGVKTFVQAPVVPDDSFAIAKVATLATTISDINAAIAATSSGAGEILVASNDASAAVKGKANYVCDGTADEVQINLAIDAAAALVARNADSPAGATQMAKVRLVGGRYNIAAPILMRTGVWLQGAGWITEIRSVSLVGGQMVALASASEHLTQLSNLWLNGNFASGGGAHGIKYDMTASGSTSTYPGINPDSDHIITYLLLTGFTTGTRHAIWLYAASGGDNNRGNIVSMCQIRSCSGDGIRFEQATDSFISDCHVGTITGNGYTINGGNTKITNCKSFYCDTYGLSIESGRNTVTGFESQDDANGIQITAANQALAGITIDTWSTNGLRIAASNVALAGIMLFNRAGGRYATSSLGVLVVGALTGVSLLGTINMSNVTTLNSGAPTTGSFVRLGTWVVN